jgi:hypothetical protein
VKVKKSKGRLGGRLSDEDITVVERRGRRCSMLAVVGICESRYRGEHLVGLLTVI